MEVHPKIARGIRSQTSGKPVEIHRISHEYQSSTEVVEVNPQIAYRLETIQLQSNRST